MKNQSVTVYFVCFLVTIISLFTCQQTIAQTPGLIVRPPGGAGVTPINPNGDGFTSPTIAGFITSDVGVGFSEIPYKTIPPFTLEPVGDLIRGPGGSFSDLVRTSVDESGLYIFSDVTNLLFRMRVGSLVSGSKGYSVLIDTDQKFGSSGPSADPNYQPATTGNNGNPGFELEVVLETNFRVAVYNVDGTSTPTLLTSYGINTNSQISAALSNVSGTPDYFYDFYVPISALTGVTATTPLRLAATTVMSPQSAIGGPKSDIFGVDDSGKDYMKDWETVINGQPPFTPTDVTSGGSGISPSCTAAPTLNSPIAAGTVTVSGTWTRADAAKPSTATITLYKNNVAAGTTTVSTGAAWSIPGVVAGANDVFYAKAQASGESSCLQSNSVSASGCAATSLLSGFAISCFSNRGFDGTVTPAGSVVRIYTVATTGYTLFADETTTTFKVIRPGATPNRWYYDGLNANSANPCTGGAADVTDASYAFTIQEPGKCESDYFYQCNGLASTTATPTLSPIYSGSGNASGTAVANTTVRLFINGVLKASTTANASGIYSFSSLIFNAGNVVDVYAQTTGQCVSGKATQTVTCFVSPPNINANSADQVIIGSTIAGISFIPGATVTVYNAATNASLGTATVQADGTWTSTVTAAVSLTYYARQATACGTSAASATISTLTGTSSARCGAITTSPLTEIVPSVGGTLSGVALTGTVVNLYLDGYFIGTTTTSTNAWGPITVNSSSSNTLYAGGVLIIGIMEPIKLEVMCPSSAVTISCLAPATPAVAPVSVIITNANGQTNFTVSNSQSGVLYTLEDLAGVDKSVSVFGNGGSITLTSYAFLTPGTFNLRVTALKLSGSSCATSAAAVTITVNDNDVDGIADVADIDDDNDGVLDSNETATFNATGDADGDGILNYRDTSPGGGLPSTDANSDGIVDAYDTDKDGIINQFDLDTDNDGIPDIIENGGTDANNDGKVDGTSDIDADGLRDAADANTSGVAGSNGLAVLDSDKDGIPNFKDLDADGDGILDTREAGLADTNNDGIADGVLGADGWSDTIDGLASLNLPNSDSSGPADYSDIDADDDGIVDNVEGQATVAYLAPAGTDTDGDGIDNNYDNNDAFFAGAANNGIIPVNTEAADLADYIDLDSDNDGFPDSFEGHDTNGDQLPDAGSNANNGVPGGTTDIDNDGLLDGYDNNTAAPDVTNGTNANSYPNIDGGTTERDWREVVNTDNAGPANNTDTDDDNDGITDMVESGGFDPLGDADADGIRNYQDSSPGAGLPVYADANGDGINDGYDADQDGIINSLDLDSDNDGIADLVEAGGVDTNGDGRVDNNADTDGDGLANVYDTDNGGVTIANLDTDGDGIPNSRDTDSDGDGIPDVVEAGGTDVNNDGKIDGYTDADADGFAQSVDGDANNDGTAENTANALIITGTDGNSDGQPDTYARANTDKLGLPNPYDLDADGDGILDIREAGLTDANNDGIADGVLGDDGWSNTVDALASLNLPNTDGLAAANYLDIDADDDGLTDNVEGQSTAGYLLPSGIDTDGDGIDDVYDNNDAAFAGNANNGITPYNHDGTDNPDYTDSDSDNDTVNDLKEGTGDVNATLTNTADTDGDGLADQFDIFNLNAETTNLQNNVTIAGMGNGGSSAGPLVAGSNVLAKQTPGAAANRDWRNNFFVLPVRFVDVKLTVSGNNYRIAWTVADEVNVKEYIVERSFDGQSFTSAGSVAYNNSGGALQTYYFNEAVISGMNGIVFYRIREVDRDGRYMFSKVVSFRTAGNKTTLIVLGNPVTANYVTINISSERSGMAALRLMDLNGRVLVSQKESITNGDNTVRLSAKTGYLANGTYFILAEINGKIFIEKVNINK